MSNQANPDKVKLQAWMDRGLMARLDGEVARRGLTRAAITAEAVRSYLDGSSAAPATREDVAALRDQVTALAEFQKAQAIALMDGVRGAIADAPVQALPSGVPEEEARRMADIARREGTACAITEIEGLQGMLADERERSRALSAELDAARAEAEALRAELAEQREEAERSAGKAGFDGYLRGIEECRRAGIAKRVLGRF